MARIDNGLVILVGRDRENPRTHREAFQITGGLGEMLDEHIKRNNLNKSEFVREAIAAKLEAEMQKEPLIKDVECREIMRLWADRCGVKTVILFGSEFRYGAKSICFGDNFGLEHLKLYTIDELCGTPEPIEPTFVDLDERVKDKEAE